MAKSKRKPALGRGLSALLNDPNKTIDSENDINSEESLAVLLIYH